MCSGSAPDPSGPQVPCSRCCWRGGCLITALAHLRWAGTGLGHRGHHCHWHRSAPAKTWQQLWFWIRFPLLLLPHLKKKYDKVSYICVHIHISIVSHDLTCHILLLQHPSEIAFLNKETGLHGVWKVLYKKVITAFSPVKLDSKFGCCFKHNFCCFCALLDSGLILNKSEFMKKAAPFYSIKWILNTVLNWQKWHWRQWLCRLQTFRLHLKRI